MEGRSTPVKDISTERQTQCVSGTRKNEVGRSNKQQTLTAVVVATQKPSKHQITVARESTHLLRSPVVGSPAVLGSTFRP